MGDLIPLPRHSPDSSQPAEIPLLGSILPRQWTRPLRPLTPASSYGYKVIWFADTVLGMPLDPWQQWAVIHGGELLEDGRPRFRQLLILVARQNGKTHLLIVLTLFWMFVEKWPTVFGTSTTLEQAAEPWEAACQIAQDTPALAAQLPRNAVRKANGQQKLTTVHRTRYLIGAVSPRGGRGKTIHRIVGDELREHKSWAGYNASKYAMQAVPEGQAIFITNAGTDESVVLNALHAEALAGVNPFIGVFEWSAVPGSHPMDPRAWVAANPSLGRRLHPDVIRADAMRVSRPGCDPEDLAGFRTEVLCERVQSSNGAIDMIAWSDLCEPGPLTAGDVTGRLVACLDIAPDGQHATLVAAALLADGRVRVEAVGAWDDAAAAIAGVRDWVLAARPWMLGWFPGGPAAAHDTELRDRRKVGTRGWPPRGVQVTEIKSDAAAVCMGLAQLVRSRGIVHSDFGEGSGQDLITAHLGNSERRARGSDGGWVFDRRAGAAGHVDGAYAVAGAAHLARIAPARRARTRAVSLAD